MTKNIKRRTFSSVGLITSAALALAACGSDDGGESEAIDTEDVLEEGGELTVWGWDPALEEVVEDFEEEYPNVEVELVNAGTGDDQYTALQNALSAGSGIPDVAQIEYYALSQFVLSEAMADLSDYGAAELDGAFSPGPWEAVNQDDGVYGLPLDSGPMALFYNKTLFDEHDVDVPETWDEFEQAARDLQEADSSIAITNDAGDAGFTTSLIWQAGGRPFDVNGTDVSIDLADEGTTKFAEFWDTMIDDELVAPISSWSDEWYQGLGDGSIATLVIGGWMRGNFEMGVEEAEGDWAVAPMPQWEKGDEVTSENGGSALSVPEESDDHELAYAFLDYAANGDGVETRIDAGAFPATTADLESEEFTEVEFDYFGGQKVNEVLAESATQVSEGWQYLPFQVYANSIFNDTVGQAYVSDATLSEGLNDWQEALVEYGNKQGFDVAEN